MHAPLEGIRVVEIAHFVAVPAAGAMLADMGAEVIKVELPPKGEIYRRSRPQFAGYKSEFPEGPGFHLDNRGKRSICLDLKRQECREALLRIIDTADIAITNLLPARRRKYGLDHETLLARRPALIVGGINGYGIGGDEADRPAFDYAAYWARSGMMDLMRDEGVAPSLLRPGVGDHAAASNLVCGLLAALRMRDATGRGRYVDVSLLQTALQILGCDLAMALATREEIPRHDRKATQNPLWNSYPVGGDRWIMLVMIDPQRYWEPLCGAIERPDLCHDPRFEDPFERASNAPALIEELERVFLTRTLSEWTERLNDAQLIWAPVRTVNEAIDDPQTRAMDYFREVEHAEAGRFETVGTPFHIEGVAVGPRGAAPAFDADSESLLREVGFDDGEIRRLRT